MPSIYYDVKIQEVELHPVLKHIVTRSWDKGGLICQVNGHEDVGLLYHLTNKKSSFHRMMMKYKDGKYRMNVWKESMASFYRRINGRKYGVNQTPRFKWHGWMLFTKAKDQIFIDNRWFQVGYMNQYNLDVEPRDVQREVRNTNWNKVPTGGLPRPYSTKEKEDKFDQHLKGKMANVY